MSTASGCARVGHRQPRPPARQPAEPRRGRRVDQPVVGEDGLDVPRAHQPEAEAEAARPDRRQEPCLLVGAQHDRDAGRRLLERLEQRRLGVLVHPVGDLDDRHARATLDRHERQVREEVLHAPIARVGAADHDLAAWSGRPETVDVGMRAVIDQPARPARPARPVGGRRGAQQAGGKVERERRLADALAVRPEHGVRGRTADHRGHRGERGGLAPGPGPVHRHARSDQAGSVDAVVRGAAGLPGAAGLRVVRRFGGASVEAGSAEVTASAAAFGLRVARGLAAAFGAGAPSATSPSASAEAAVAAVSAALRVAGLRVARGLAGAASAPASTGADVVAVLVGDVVRGAAGLRAARGLEMGSSSMTTGAARSSGAGLTEPAGGRLGAGFWATCARSIASSSGGTSLHGSFELRCGGAEVTGRSPRL